MTSFAPLTLHVPEPAGRPGGAPSFDLEIPDAGSVRRPDVDVAPEEIRDLAYTIIRVLDDSGLAVGPWAGTLSDEEVLEGLRTMMRVRAYDARMLLAQRQGKTSFYMQHLGRVCKPEPDRGNPGFSPVRGKPGFAEEPVNGL